MTAFLPNGLTEATYVKKQFEEGDLQEKVFVLVWRKIGENFAFHKLITKKNLHVCLKTKIGKILSFQQLISIKLIKFRNKKDRFLQVLY